MEKIVSLTIEKEEIKGIELTKKKAFLVTGILSSKEEIREYFTRRKTPVVFSISSLNIFIRNFSISSEMARSKKRIQEFIEKKKFPFPLQECSWDYLLRKNNLVLFAVKNTDIERYLSLLKDINIKPSRITVNPLALVNFCLFLYPQKKEFTILSLTKEEGFLVSFYKERFFSFAIPLAGIETILSQAEILGREVSRIINYLHSQENVPSSAFSELYLAGGVQPELIKRLSDILKKKLILLEALKKLKILSEEEKFLRLDELPQLLGAGLAELERSFLRINLLKTRGPKEIIGYYQEKIVLNRNYILGWSFVFLLFLDIFLILKINHLRKAIVRNKDIYQRVLPRYREFKRRYDFFSKPLGFLESCLKRRYFLIESLNLIDKHLNNSKLKISQIKFTRGKDGRDYLELLLISNNYQSVSDFLKGLESEKYFSEINPVGRRTEKTQEEGVLYFKIEAVR